DATSVFFFQAEDGIRDRNVTGVQTCALPICLDGDSAAAGPFLQTVPQAGGAVVAVDVEESDPVGGRQVLEAAGPQQTQARGDADAGCDQGRRPAEDAGGGHGSVRAGGEEALPGLELGHGPG